MVDALARGYDRFTGLLFRHGWLGTLVTLGLLVVAARIYRQMGTDFLPAMDEGSIVMDYWTPPGTSLTDTDQMLRVAEKQIVATPGVVSYSRRLGTQMGFFITEPNTGDYLINLAPRQSRRPIGQIMDELRQRIAAVEPAIHTDFGQVLEDNIGDLTGGTPQPVDVKIFDDDPTLLKRRAREAATLVAQVPGIRDVFNGMTIAGPALEVRVHPEAAARYGLSTDSVEAAVEPALVGTVAGSARVGERVYDVRVFVNAGDGAANLKRLPVRLPNGKLLPLGSVASVQTGPPETEIDRENLRSYLGVTARLSGRDLGSAIHDIQQTLKAHLPRAPGMSIEYGGMYAQQQSSFAELFIVLLAGLVLVSIVVLFEFADWRAPIATTLTALASLAGVLELLKLTGMTLNISSYVGAIMMVGIVGENAIFVIHEGKLELQRGLPTAQAWTEASRRRLRPVAMTILATALALSPLALALGEGSQLMQPLAIAVIGGFVLSGPAVLFLLPSVYALLDPKGRLGRGPAQAIDAA